MKTGALINYFIKTFKVLNLEGLSGPKEGRLRNNIEKEKMKIDDCTLFGLIHFNGFTRMAITQMKSLVNNKILEN